MRAMYRRSQWAHQLAAGGVMNGGHSGGHASSRLLSVGGYQPARVMENAELATMVNTSEEWIRSRLGILRRRVAGADESVSDMAASAAAKTLVRSGIAAASIDVMRTS
jgi:3-oxoacyl-[acyl-carrier-protein] synthase III